MGMFGESSAATVKDAADPMLRDRHHPGSIAEVMRKYKQVLRSLPKWHIQRIDHDERVIGTERRSVWAWAVTDVVLTFSEEGDGVRVKAWSESRSWSFDFGANRRNLRDLFASIDRDYDRGS